MAEVTNELFYEVLKQIQGRLGAVDRKIDEVKGELQAVRTHSMAMQQDTANIYSILVRHDTRLDRIERRLELTEVS
jgi:tetrahydromethanopterin S-methyltransferase subunit G